MDPLEDLNALVENGQFVTYKYVASTLDMSAQGAKRYV